MGLDDLDPGSVVRDWNLLESALARPRMAAYYEGADLFSQAATLLWGLIQNHPFHDGNKRTGWIIARGFLRANCWDIRGTEDDHFTLIVGIAQGTPLDDAEAWLRQHVSAIA
jgi:death-on-curing protein